VPATAARNIVSLLDERKGRRARSFDLKGSLG
jgi:hypothetical protein